MASPTAAPRSGCHIPLSTTATAAIWKTAGRIRKVTRTRSPRASSKPWRRCRPAAGSAPRRNGAAFVDLRGRRAVLRGSDRGVTPSLLFRGLASFQQLDRYAFGRAEKAEAHARPHGGRLHGEFGALGLELSRNRVNTGDG